MGEKAKLELEVRIFVFMIQIIRTQRSTTL